MVCDCVAVPNDMVVDTVIDIDCDADTEKEPVVVSEIEGETLVVGDVDTVAERLSDAVSETDTEGVAELERERSSDGDNELDFVGRSVSVGDTEVVDVPDVVGVTDPRVTVGLNPVFVGVSDSVGVVSSLAVDDPEGVTEAEIVGEP